MPKLELKIPYIGLRMMVVITLLPLVKADEQFEEKSCRFLRVLQKSTVFERWVKHNTISHFSSLSIKYETVT